MFEKLTGGEVKAATDSSFEPTILVVDDDDNYRKTVAEYLRGEGFEILEASLSSKACALVRQRRPSLVLLDWDLQNYGFRPDEPSTGSEILRVCHELDPLLPVLVMSRAQGLDPQTDSLLAGADGLIKKPFALLSVATLLHPWMARLEAEKNPFTRLSSGIIEKAETVNRAYARAVVERVGSALQAAPKLGLSRQTVASYLASSTIP